MASEVGTDFLGTLSLRSSYRDNSKPTVLIDDEVAEEYENLMGGMQESLAKLGLESA